MRSQVWIVNEFHDRVRQRLSVTRFDKQTVLAIAKNLRNITDFRRDDWTSTGESFTQDDRRRFGSKGSNNDHVARCINVGCVPAISSHNDFIGQSGPIDCVPYVDAAFQNPRALAYDDEAGIRTLL